MTWPESTTLRGTSRRCLKSRSRRAAALRAGPGRRARGEAQVPLPLTPNSPGSAAGSEGELPEVPPEADSSIELILPGEGEVAAQEAAARRAVEAINHENADETFDDLEALITAEEAQ